MPTTVLVFQAGGPTDGTSQVLSQAHGALTAGATHPFFPGAGVNVRTATADLTGDGVPDYIGGTGPGVVTRVVVLDGVTLAAIASFQPFEVSFTGGVHVAAADLSRDGRAEVIVTPDQGGGPVVVVYRGAELAAGNASELARFLGIEDPDFRGGARPALGDVNGDGVADLVIGAGFLGGPRVAIYDGVSVLAGEPVKLISDFFAFESTLRNGAFFAAGDVTGDGVAELAFGGGPGSAPRVRLFDGKALCATAPFPTLDSVPAAQLANFFAGDASQRGGVRLALRDTDGDGAADLVTGSGDAEPALVRVYESATLLAGPTDADQEIDPFAGTAAPFGVFVG